MTPAATTTGVRLGRPLAVLDSFMARSALRGEWAVSYTRLVLSILGLTRVLTFGGWGGLLGGETKYLLIVPAHLMAMGWSVWMLSRREPGPRLRTFLMVSVVVDALLLLPIMLAIQLWPSPTYVGFLRTPEAGLYLVALITPGLRLSRRVAALGGTLVLALHVVYILVDYLLRPERMTYGLSEIAIWTVLVAGSGVLGLAVAGGARRLVFRGAEAVLQAERARQRLGVYVSEEVASAALASDVLETGGRRQPVAVLFSDLRGFTHYGEKLPPERLVLELNEYLDAMVRAVRAEGGVVDKFIGDSVMAVFGIPQDRPGDALRAIRTAQAMDKALAALNLRRAARGATALAHGVGVHYGLAVAGNIGNADRLQYTVVGDVVNLASRLQSLSKELGVSLVISTDTVEAAAADGTQLPELRSLGNVHVRGREGEIGVHTLAETGAGDLRESA